MKMESRKLATCLIFLGCTALSLSMQTSVAAPRAAEGSQTPETVPSIASYQLTARLDAQRHVIDGKGTILYKNPSHLPTSRLFFHLYLNAFADDDTLFLRDAASRSGRRRGRRGSIAVHTLKSPSFGPEDLWPKDAHTPGDPDDRTDIEVMLPRPLRGHETIQLEIEFSARLPQLVERTGFEHRFHLVAQWFPKLAKRETSGRWAHFPFHPHGEFYADFGNYDVILDVPSEYVVGSTGQLKKLPQSSKGRTRYRALARAVHDFAWTAWPQFVAQRRRIGDVHVTLLRPPHSPRVAQASWTTLKTGLKHLQHAYGPYPYPTLTVVQPPTWARRAGGMEYPQFITTGGSEALAAIGVRATELVTIHELAHQWFQGMLASNEMRHPFLDEGLTSYAEARYLDERFGAGSLSDFPVSISRQAGARFISASAGSTPISAAASEFESFSEISSLVYSRSLLCLETLGRVYSFRRLHAALRLYATRFRFRHPTPEDFFDTLGENMGAAAQKQAELMFNDKGSIDWLVEDIEISKSENGYLSRVRVSRTGSLELPTTLAVRFSDGKLHSVPLEPAREERTYDFAGEFPVESAHVDPSRTILIDDNLENNRAYGPRAAPKRSRQRLSLAAMAGWAIQALSP